jgi:hypothetical protein
LSTVRHLTSIKDETQGGAGTNLTECSVKPRKTHFLTHLTPQKHMNQQQNVKIKTQNSNLCIKLYQFK